VAAVPDPFGGSYFLERLTLDLEAGARDYIRTIDEMGGMIPAIEQNFPQGEIAKASYEYQKRVESKEAVVVGVNRFVEQALSPVLTHTLKIDQSAEDRQSEKLRVLREKRSAVQVDRALKALRRAAETTENLMPPLMDAVRTRATLGEICNVLREVFGSWQERSVY
jgi:methylmalonyl-CoA mutase N-terminal domain/subunit